jgi:SAM-dependent methyltransferase
MMIDEPGYFERLARVEAGHWWSRAMWRLASDWLSRAIRGRNGLEALDVGCGAGLSLIRLSGHREIARVIGLEPDPGALRLARRHAGFEVIRGSATDLPFDSSNLDVLTCFDVLQHLPEGGDRQAVDEIARVLRPTGLVLIRTNSAGFGRGRSRGGSAYRLSELTQMITESGLVILRSSHANFLPSLAQEIRGRLRFVAGSRGSSWRPHPAGGGLQLDVPSVTVNRFMGAISSFERSISTRLGCSLPFGHSTMILARKPGGSG